MKFAREKQREESALHDQPALHGAAPTYRTQTQTHFTEQYPYSKTWFKHHNPQLSKLCLTCVRTFLLNTWITTQPTPVSLHQGLVMILTNKWALLILRT